ncbi:glycosyltransferase family 8 protein [Pantanalinema sp. GBBB05]|uniref:glycosyltransferase family 8 protein n=1 Tax=Pantanalinema sp. GBBB05 TaxID=2604139 RepID=UPI001DA7A87F|nr:glycosyltransferase family 8 protein [Pantanalinema sp. GBBB05]
MSHLETVNVVCTIDNNYIQHCAVMLTSLLKNNYQLKFKIFIIKDNLDHQLEIKLINFLDNCNQDYSLITVDDSIFLSAPISKHISLATYYRLLIPQLVDSKVEKILFLDSDIVIRKSITPLWNIDISNYSHAAVKNPGVSFERKQNLKMPEDSAYFNAGVLLINLRVWRELAVTQRAIEFIEQYPEKIDFHDQDVLNHVLCNQWFSIESQWNAQYAFFFKDFSLEDFGGTLEAYQQAKYDPAIIHFTGSGSCKPWHYNCNHPFKEDYYKYLNQTPWRGFKYISRPSLVSRLKAKTKGIIQKIK